MKKNKNKILILILSIITLVLTVSCSKKVSLPEASYDFYVYDDVNIINESTKSYIIDINKDLYEKTGSQIVVASVDSLQDIDISSYALKLYEKWEIGSKEYDNGVLILISPNDGSIWIEVGYGLEGQLIDSKVRKIIENDMIPYFINDNYSDGILVGFNEILKEVEIEYDLVLRDSKLENELDKADKVEEDRRGIPNIFLIIGVIIFLFIDFTFFRGMLVYSLLRGFGRGGGPGNTGGSGGSSGGGGRSGGGGSGGSW